MTEDKSYQNPKIKKENGKAIIEAEIPTEVIEKHKKKVIKESQKDMEKPGFRKGNVPLDMVEQELGMEETFHKAANSSLNEAYSQIIKDHNLQVMSAPKVSVTKLAPGNPLNFKIEVATIPEFELPEYKKIAGEITKETNDEKIEVTEEEEKQVINQILKMYTQAKNKGGAAETFQVARGHSGNNKSGIVDKDGKPLKSEEQKEKTGEVETEAPKLTDEFVRALGKFENVEDFRNKIRENLKQEKEMAKIRESREKIAKKLIEKTNLEIPEITIESELQLTKNKLEQDLEQQKLSMEEYMKKVGTTEEKFFKEQRNYIEQQLKSKIILEKIAEKENIEPDENQVEAQALMLKQRYPKTEEAVLKDYVRMMMKNEKVFEILEGGDTNDSEK